MDFEDDFFLDSCTLHEKRKRKKDSKKDKKGQKPKTSTTVKTPENVPKKKKSSKFKEAMEARKEKKKEKKKKKKRSALEMGDTLVHTQGKPLKTPEASDLRQNEKPKPEHATQDTVKKTKRKNKVTFDSPPGHIRARRPKFEKEEKEAAGDGESCPQVPATEDESQCSGDDYNSQDLFITQKTFRSSPSQPSSGEVAHEAFAAFPQGFSQRGERWCTSQLHEDLHQRVRNEPQVKTLKDDQVSPYLDEPAAVNSSPDAAQINTSSYRGHIHESPSLPPSAVSTSTQTENFFTAELSSYLSFRLKYVETVRTEDLKPLDLSLPQRARKDTGRRLSVITPGEDEKRFSDRKTSALPGEIKGAEVKTETTPSPECESEVKAVDTTTSSEDNDLSWRSGKMDLTQVRAVQTRLNESFFFKTKGEGRSPRPESPLMKLSQGRSIKTKKRQ